MINRRELIRSGAGLATAGALATCNKSSKDQKQPNILLLVVDDMIPAYARESHLSSVVPTPNLDRLAKRGTAFENAYTPAPVCNPARTALFTGLYPHRSGVYTNSQWWRPALPGHATLFERFKEQGYRVEGAGKVYHHTVGFNPPEQWHTYQDLKYDDYWARPEEWKKLHPNEAIPDRPQGHPFSGLGYFAHEFDWGALAKKEEEYGDMADVSFAVER